MVINFTSASYGLKIHTLIFPKISELMVRLLSGESRMFEILRRGSTYESKIFQSFWAPSQNILKYFVTKGRGGQRG